MATAAATVVVPWPPRAPVKVIVGFIGGPPREGGGRTGGKLGSALLAGRRAASPTATAVRRWMSGTSSARRAIPVLVEVVRRCEPWPQPRAQPVGERGGDPSYAQPASGGGRPPQPPHAHPFSGSAIL